MSEAAQINLAFAITMPMLRTALLTSLPSALICSSVMFLLLSISASSARLSSRSSRSRLMRANSRNWVGKNWVYREKVGGGLVPTNRRTGELCTRAQGECAHHTQAVKKSPIRRIQSCLWTFASPLLPASSSLNCLPSISRTPLARRHRRPRSRPPHCRSPNPLPLLPLFAKTWRKRKK